MAEGLWGVPVAELKVEGHMLRRGVRVAKSGAGRGVRARVYRERARSGLGGGG